jgi:uncharacterized membrane protein
MSRLFSIFDVAFVHPELAAGAAVMGLVPVAIHLINRRRYVRVPWAAMSFLLAARRRSARRVRIEQWLLLASRVILITAAGLVAARPYVPASALIPGAATHSHRIVLMDNSLSMNARDENGSTRFDTAKAYAERLVNAFPPGDAVSIVTMARPAASLLAPAALDRRRVRERLGAVNGTQRATDVPGAVDRALRMLNESDAAPGNRFVYVLSDMQKNAWTGSEGTSASPALAALGRLADVLGDPGHTLTVVRVGPEQTANVAVTHLAAEGPLAAVGLPLTVTMEVTNFGNQTAQGLAVELRQGGRIFRREALPPAAPGASVRLPVTLEFAAPGVQALEARLLSTAADAVIEDQFRFLSVEVRRTIPVLLVDGRPSSGRFGGAAGFVATALAPTAKVPAGGLVEPEAASGASATSLFEPRTITEAELGGEALRDYSVVVLCSVAGLPAAQWKTIEQYVADGGGLLVFSGELVGADNYNAFGHAGGKGLLPGTFGPVMIGSPDAVPEAPTGNQTSALRGGHATPHFGFKAEKFLHPVLEEFNDHPTTGLFTAEVHQYLSLQVTSPRAEVILRYSNGDPALIVSAFGRGKAVLCTTSANLEWNNLPAKGDFVSLLFNLMGYLCRREGESRTIEVGDWIREPISAEQSSLPCEIVLKEEVAVRPSLVATADSFILQYGPVESAGIYPVSIGSEVRPVAVNTPPEESDLNVFSEREFRAVFDRPCRWLTARDDLSAGAIAPKTTELSRFVWILVSVLCFVELVLATAFGPGRRGAG